nr:hypothetical protein [Tanacetum cinerariifolium]
MNRTSNGPEVKEKDTVIASTWRLVDRSLTSAEFNSLSGIVPSTVDTKYSVELADEKRDNVRLEGTLGVKRQRVDRLWRKNGNSFKSIPRITVNADCTSTSTIPGPVTTEEKVQKKNDVKARSMLLMALPNEHLLIFSQYKDAKTLFEAIQVRFGGNDAIKKTRRTLLKQMYENFNAPSTKSLDSFFNSNNEVDTASIQVSAASTPVSNVSSPDNTTNLSDRTGKKITINGSDTAGYDKTKVECFNCHKMGHFLRECKSPRNQESKPRNQDNSRKTVIMEDTSSKAMVVIDGPGIFTPPTIDLSNSGLKEFKQPELEGYGPKASKSVSMDTSNEIEKALDTPIIKDWVSDSDEDENFAPTAVLTKSDIVPVSAARQSSSRAAAPVSAARHINTAAFKPLVNVAKPKKMLYKQHIHYLGDLFTNKQHFKNRNLNNNVNVVKANSINTAKGNKVTSVVGNKGINDVKSSACWVWRPKIKVQDHVSKNSGSYICKCFDYGAPQDALKDQGYFDSGCSRHMTGNISYLTDFKKHDGGYVAFEGGAKGDKITRKGTIMTGKLDFEDVYFVKELQFNLFSVLQMCDKKNSGLFTNTECFVLSPNFKLADESQILLKVPRKNNMYSFDMKNIIPQKDLTFLLVKAINDESMLWHKRLGHINFKNINKHVKDDLLRGLPSKCFENNQTFFACLKGKQHIVSFKSKIQNSISQPLFMLHMDLFGPTSVLRGNDVSRTPQKNEVAKRRNSTLIEAARTMLVDSKLPTTFLAEAVNTTYRLGKFDGKSDDGIFVGYSTTSKAFRVYNIMTRKVKENLHITFLENKPMIVALDSNNKDKHGPSQASESDNQERPNAESSTKTVNIVGPINTATPTYAEYPNDPLMPDLEDAGIFDDAYDDRDKGVEDDYNNLETVIPIEPKKVTQALDDETWVEAMQEELLQFKLLNVWTLVDLPPRKRAIGTKWGHRQEEGIDYDEVFAPVARIKVIKLFLAYASFMDFTVYQMDVKSSFLYGTIEEEVYVSQHLGFVDPEFPDRVYKVEKALYGLHQAPRAWYETLSTYLLDNGFKRGTINNTLFIKKIKDDILLVQVYVDDITFGSTKSQDKYVSDILKKFGFSSVKSASTPMETHKALSKDAVRTDNVKKLEEDLKMAQVEVEANPNYSTIKEKLSQVLHDYNTAIDD